MSEMVATSGKCFLLFFGGVILFVVICAQPSHAQPQKVSLTLISEKIVTSSDEVKVEKVWVKPDVQKKPKQIPKMKGILTFANKNSIEIPDFEHVRISKDKSTIVRIGDHAYREDPPSKNIYWHDAQGRQTGSLHRISTDGSVISISDDGYTVVGGWLTPWSDKQELRLFTPKGKMIWGLELENNEFIRSALVFPGGHRVAAIVSGAHRMKNNKVRIFEKGNEVSQCCSEWRFLGGLSLLNDNRTIFIANPYSFGILETNTGHIIWKQSVKRSVSADNGALLSPDGKILFLLTYEGYNLREKNGYALWTLRALDNSSGVELATKLFPQKDPLFTGKIENITPSEIMILINNRLFTCKWKRSGGGQ